MKVFLFNNLEYYEADFPFFSPLGKVKNLRFAEMMTPSHEDLQTSKWNVGRMGLKHQGLPEASP